MSGGRWVFKLSEDETMKRRLSTKKLTSFVQQSVAMLGTDQEIYHRLSGDRQCPLILDFIEALQDELTERSVSILYASPEATVENALRHSVACQNLAEQAVPAVRNLLEKNGTVADLKRFTKTFYTALFALDVAAGLVTDRKSWLPPSGIAQVLLAVGEELAHKSNVQKA